MQFFEGRAMEAEFNGMVAYNSFGQWASACNIPKYLLYSFVFVFFQLGKFTRTEIDEFSGIL